MWLHCMAWFGSACSEHVCRPGFISRGGGQGGFWSPLPTGKVDCPPRNLFVGP